MGNPIVHFCVRGLDAHCMMGTSTCKFGNGISAECSKLLLSLSPSLSGGAAYTFELPLVTKFSEIHHRFRLLLYYCSTVL